MGAADGAVDSWAAVAPAGELPGTQHQDEPAGEDNVQVEGGHHRPGLASVVRREPDVSLREGVEGALSVLADEVVGDGER
jgi:hypothetical protein